MLLHLMHTGSDYLVNSQNPSSRTFTVTFQSMQANSTEHEIQLGDDRIAEGTEAFLLRIVAARFIGEAGRFFRVPPALCNTVADVIIEDDDCKFMNTPCIICLQTVTRRRTYAYLYLSLSPPTVIAVSWIISETIEVREGQGVRLELFAQAFGLYANPVEFGVVCAEVIAAGVPPGADSISSTDTLEHAIIYHTSPTCLQPSLAETLKS